MAIEKYNKSQFEESASDNHLDNEAQVSAVDDQNDDVLELDEVSDSLLETDSSFNSAESLDSHIDDYNNLSSNNDDVALSTHKEDELIRNNDSDHHNFLDDVKLEPSDLDILTVFEIGQARIPLNDLHCLADGYTFILNYKLDQEINITVNGKCIAKGVLVQVNDNLGVKITKLFF